MAIRTLLILGRVSNLPTVWSNVFCAWLLSGGNSLSSLMIISLGVSFLYIGGMFLNDFCDRDFDKAHCPQRPIPSGRTNANQVALWSILWFVVGVVLIASLQDATGLALSLGLVLSIVAYDIFHKKISWSPFLMGLCRFLIYPLTAALSPMGIDEAVMVMGLAMLLYIIALSHVAKMANKSPEKSPWVLAGFLIGGSALLVWLPGSHLGSPLTLAAFLLLIFWVWRAKRNPVPRNADQLVGQLLSGMILLDLLGAAAHVGLGAGALAIFLGCFLLTILAQDVIPAN